LGEALKCTAFSVTSGSSRLGCINGGLNVALVEIFVTVFILAEFVTGFVLAYITFAATAKASQKG